ncbi:neurogenic differentiation factor 2-like [Haliotis cracherodii]|uniref:neurogenic differentiation factor 2-like n=1 Tax=Haliotis cracherodii TaxID=6455 RepID=UPI0039EB94D0
MEEKARLHIENLGSTSFDTLDEEQDTGYLSDSSALEDLPKRRGRKRKDMCPDDAEKKRVTANFQERQRMLNLNSALDRLRECLPDQFKVGNRRTSKIRTLRLAASYIRSLGDLLKQDSIIRESMPPQPGFDPRLPCMNDVNRQGDGGEIYTPEKDISFPQQQEALTHTTPDYRYPFYGHHQFGSSPHFNYSSHTTPSSLQQHPAFSQHPLQYLPMYPPQFYPPGLHPLPPTIIGEPVNQHIR